MIFDALVGCATSKHIHPSIHPSSEIETNLAASTPPLLLLGAAPVLLCLHLHHLLPKAGRWHLLQLDRRRLHLRLLDHLQLWLQQHRRHLWLLFLLHRLRHLHLHLGLRRLHKRRLHRHHHLRWHLRWHLRRHLRVHLFVMHLGKVLHVGLLLCLH